MINEVPALPTNWSAAVTQLIDGNFAGGPPKGTTYFNQYCDEVKGYYRYEYTKEGKNEVYRYNDKDAATGCGLFYSWTTSSCCRKALTLGDGICYSA